MAELVIRDEHLAWQLLDRAQRENRSVEEVLESLLAQSPSHSSEDYPAPGTFASLAESARRANIGSGHPVDTSIRSREILENEYADYLKKRMEDQHDTD